MRGAIRAVFSIVLLAVSAAGAPAVENTRDVYDALGLKEKDVLTGTVLAAKVVPGGRKQVVSLVTHFTGKKEKSEAIKVRLDVFEREGRNLVSVYSRDFGAESGEPVGRGEIQLVDLDRDGVSEIILTYDSYADPLIEQRHGEVIYLAEDGFRVGWAGIMGYDATRSAREVPLARRDRYVREVDVPGTIRSRGVTLFMNKKMISVAGERLPEPKVIRETFPLRPSATEW